MNSHLVRRLAVPIAVSGLSQDRVVGGSAVAFSATSLAFRSEVEISLTDLSVTNLLSPLKLR